MIKRTLFVSSFVVLAMGSLALAGQEQPPTAPKGEGDGAAACSAMMGGQGVTAEGRAEMEQFMQSGKMTEAMTGMMEMTRRMGSGDLLKGMVRMMEMMGSMGSMSGHGMMSPGLENPSTPSGHAPQETPAR